MRVNTGIADRFIADAIYLIAHDGVHRLHLTGHLKSGFHGAVRAALFDRTPQRFGKVIHLSRGGSQGI